MFIPSYVNSIVKLLSFVTILHSKPSSIDAQNPGHGWIYASTVLELRSIFLPLLISKFCIFTGKMKLPRKMALVNKYSSHLQPRHILPPLLKPIIQQLPLLKRIKHIRKLIWPLRIRNRIFTNRPIRITVTRIGNLMELTISSGLAVRPRKLVLPEVTIICIDSWVSVEKKINWEILFICLFLCKVLWVFFDFV